MRFVVQLWRFLCQFGIRNLEEDRLYSFIQQAYFDSKKQPTISDFFNTASRKKVSSGYHLANV